MNTCGCERITLGLLVYPQPEFTILTFSIDPTDVTTASNSPPVPLPSMIIVGGISVLYPDPVWFITISSIPLNCLTTNVLLVFAMTGV